MAGNEDPTKKEEEEEADLVYGSLLGEVKDSLTAAKRKADVASSDEKAEATGNGDVKAPIKWVEMPLEYITWLLAEKKEKGLIADLTANNEDRKEELFEFQEWVRDTFDKNGCVMVPEDFNFPDPGRLQEVIDEAWEKGLRELELIDGCPLFDREDEDTAGAALPSN